MTKPSRPVYVSAGNELAAWTDYRLRLDRWQAAQAAAEAAERLTRQSTLASVPVVAPRAASGLTAATLAAVADCPACGEPLAPSLDGFVHVRSVRAWSARRAMYVRMLAQRIALAVMPMRVPAPLRVPADKHIRAAMWAATALTPESACQFRMEAEVTVRRGYRPTQRPDVPVTYDASTDGQREAARAVNAHWNVPMRTTDYDRRQPGQHVRRVPRYTPSEYRRQLGMLD